jgi:pSer/pThr/pTyr-binding forkhead associated (FHA) protein
MANLYKLVLKSGGEKNTAFFLKAETTIIGRDPISNFVIDDIEVSRNHLVATIKEKSVFIEDLDSTNGSYLNGKRLKKLTEVKSGDLITLGKSIVIEFIQEQDDDLTPEDINELKSQSHVSNETVIAEEDALILEPLEQEDFKEKELAEEEKVDEDQVIETKVEKHIAFDKPIEDSVEKETEITDGKVQKELGAKLKKSQNKLPTWVFILVIVLGLLVIFCVIPLLVIEFTNQWCNLFAGFFNSMTSGACP